MWMFKYDNQVSVKNICTYHVVHLCCSLMTIPTCYTWSVSRCTTKFPRFKDKRLACSMRAVHKEKRKERRERGQRTSETHRLNVRRTWDCCGCYAREANVSRYPICTKKKKKKRRKKQKGNKSDFRWRRERRRDRSSRLPKDRGDVSTERVSGIPDQFCFRNLKCFHE